MNSAQEQPLEATLNGWIQSIEQSLVDIETQQRLLKWKQESLRDQSSMLKGSIDTLTALQPVLSAATMQ